MKEDYYRIYNEVYESPTVSVRAIAENLGLPCSTVYRYLKDMYEREILVGPYILMKPAPNYKEYVYLLNFSNPYAAFEALEQLPQVVYCAMVSGDWDIVVITDSPLNYSSLEGFQNIVDQGVRGFSYTPKVRNTTWEEGFEQTNKYIAEFVPAEKERSEAVPPLDWREDEWKLFRAFQHGLREKKIPVLREIEVRHDFYLEWMRTLNDHCTVHTEFHPRGYISSGNAYFLFSSEYGSQVRSLFSLLPVTSFFTEVGDKLLVLTNIAPPNLGIELFLIPNRMQKKGMIKESKQAAFFFDYKRNKRNSRL